MLIEIRCSDVKRVWKGAKGTVTIRARGRCPGGVINPSNGRGLSR